jgi:hypothetical protein
MNDIMTSSGQAGNLATVRLQGVTVRELNRSGRIREEACKDMDADTLARPIKQYWKEKHRPLDPGCPFHDSAGSPSLARAGWRRTRTALRNGTTVAAPADSR